MVYLISFLEGIITFISPCLLPMIPIYLIYFAGGDTSLNTKKTLINAFGFVFGFSIIFISLGAFAGSVGAFLKEYQLIVNIITGLFVIFLGLNFLGVLIFLFLKISNKKKDMKNLNFIKTFLFGVTFSVSWTPCVGAFLGSALMLASQQGSVLKGILMLICYSLGLGIPFILSALLINKLKSAFDFIKSHYKLINTVCGILLIFIGILMASGLMNKFLYSLNF